MVSRSAAYDLYKSEYLHRDATEELGYATEGQETENVVGEKLDWSQVESTFNPADFHDADQPLIIFAATVPEDRDIRVGGMLIDSGGIKYVIRSFVLQRWDTQYHCICSKVAYHDGQ